MLSRFYYRCLITQTRKRLFAAEHVQHVEDPGRRGFSRQRRAERLRHVAELAPGLLGKTPHRRFELLLHPGLDDLKARQKLRDHVARLGIEQFRRLLIELEGALGEEEGRVVEQLDESLGALL